MIFRLAIGVLLGVCWVQMQATLPAERDFWPYLGGLLLAVLIIWRWRPVIASWVWPIAVAVAAAMIATIVARHELGQRLSPALDRESLWLEVVVNDLPSRHERGWRFEVSVITARHDRYDTATIVNFPVRGVMHWYDNGGATVPSVLAPGQHWAMQARVRQPIGTLNPGGFDYEAWMFEKKLYFSATVQQGKRQEAPVLLGEIRGPQILIDQTRDAIRQQVEARIPESSARDVIAALLVGDQRAISVSDWAIFQRTGVSHLMSISGLHVTMLASLAGALGAMLWRLLCAWPIAAALWIPVQTVRALFAIVGALGYAMLAGFAVPAQRTALMVFVVSLATLLGIRANPWAVLSAALLIVVISDPVAILAPGFWLSFMAVGFLFALPSAQADLKKQRIFLAIQEAGQAQLAITFGLLPITVLFFQQIVLVGPLANAIAIPVVSFGVTPLAMAGIVEAGWLGTGGLLALSAWIQEVLEIFLAWCAGLTFATIDWPAPGLWRTIIASFGMLIALGRVLPPNWHRYRHIGWCGLLALFGAAPNAPMHGQMEATFIDVGQGSSVLIRTHRHVLLYDTGPSFGASDAGQRMVLPTLRRHGIRQIDRLMISHSDQDHDGGVASIAALMPIGMTLASTPENYVGARPCRSGDQWRWDGVTFQVLHPKQPDEKDRNAASCVLRIQDAYGGSLLLAGDIPAKTEEALVLQSMLATGALPGAIAHRHSALLSAQVLLAPHHGSKTSSSLDFLRAVRPEWLVIQAGYRNRFGHPHPDVLARMSELPGVRIARTDLDGALVLRWRDGQPVMRSFRDDHQRYWHVARFE